jgi:D-3-phosphoglycerate dehydrogenase
MKVLVCDPISPKGIALLQQRPEFQVTVLPKRLSEAELLPLVSDVSAMVVRSETHVTSKIFDAAPKLRVVGRAGVGVDNINVDAATQHGVVVMNTPGGNTITTAELTFAMLLNVARKVPQAHASMVGGQWDRKKFQGVELEGKTLGVIAVGRIGSEVAKRAMAFGMRVLGYDPFLSEARAKALGVELVDLDTLLSQSDFITLHALVTEQTRGMLNAAAFAKMKPKVCIVNCARGELIVEGDLIAALDSGKVAAAALDVYSQEPLPEDHPFRKHPAITLTPHLGASTAEAQEKCGIEVAEVVTSYLLTGEVRNAVNLPYLDAKTYEQVKPYLALGEKLGKLLAQLAPQQQVDKLYITYGGKARELPNIDPITRAILLGFLSRAEVKDLNNVNVRSIASTLGLTVEEKRSNEPVTFNEWLHVQASNGGLKVLSAGGTFFGSPDNPRIVRVFSQPTEIVPFGVVLLLNNKDRPGIVGYLGTLLAKHKVNIASMSLSRDTAGGFALTALNLDSVPPAEVLDEIRNDPDISNVAVVKL